MVVCLLIVLTALAEVHSLQESSAIGAWVCRWALGGLIVGAGLELLGALKGHPLCLDLDCLVLRCSLAVLGCVRWAGREGIANDFFRAPPGAHGWGF